VSLAVFRAKGTILGSTSTTVSPTVYLVVGVIALVAGVFASTKRGRELIGREMERKQGAEPNPKGSIADRARGEAQDLKDRRGSLSMAVVVGVLLGAPSPFSLAAVARMVRNAYARPAQLVLNRVFALITYLVVEVPIIS